jgi:hypothetical protein
VKPGLIPHCDFRSGGSLPDHRSNVHSWVAILTVSPPGSISGVAGRLVICAGNPGPEAPDRARRWFTGLLWQGFAIAWSWLAGVAPGHIVMAGAVTLGISNEAGAGRDRTVVTWPGVAAGQEAGGSYSVLDMRSCDGGHEKLPGDGQIAARWRP